MRVLMVAEKPSIAQAITKILSKGKSKTVKGIATPVHEFSGSFKGRECTFVVTSVTGHVYALDFVSAGDWSEDPRNLFEASTVKKESNAKQGMCNHLKRVSRDCQVLVLWLDCDREGENIGFEVMKNCNGINSIHRARFSSVTSTEVYRAMQNLVAPNENESKAVDARQEIDLKVGVSFTRYQTMRFYQKYADLNSDLISYGPCQTPTLCFCVDRHDEIVNFKSSTYYKLQAIVDLDGRKTKLKWLPQRVYRELADIKQLQKNISSHTNAVCVEFNRQNKVTPRPVGLNTVQMLKAASSGLGINAWECMSLAEKLYMQGYISYPRTESTCYPSDFDFESLISEFKSAGPWEKDVKELFSNWVRPRAGVNVGDHPPILPTRMAQPADLRSASEWRLYEYVVNYFFGTISCDSVVEAQSMCFLIGEEKFNLKGIVFKELGFLKFMQWLKPLENCLPSIAIGNTLPVHEVYTKECHTKPPGYLTESELIGLMERHRIGTDASIPTHIENIIKRNYVSIEQRKNILIPTKLGITLIHGYKLVDPELALPQVRATIENHINQIASGKIEYSIVVSQSLDLFLSKYDNFVSKIDVIDSLFAKNFETYSATQIEDCNVRPQCGTCKRYMRFIKSRPRRLFCNTCDKSFKLPKFGGDIKEGPSNQTCHLDSFQILYLVNDDKRSTPFCPKCFNENESMSCTVNCTKSSCHLNINNFVVSRKCLQCQVGMLTLDQLNPVKIFCSKCKFSIKLIKNLSHCKVLHSKPCEQCNGDFNLMLFKFTEKNTPKPGLLQFEACIHCDPVMSVKCPKIYFKESQSKSKKFFQPNNFDNKSGISTVKLKVKPSDKPTDSSVDGEKSFKSKISNSTTNSLPKHVKLRSEHVPRATFKKLGNVDTKSSTNKSVNNNNNNSLSISNNNNKSSSISNNNNKSSSISNNNNKSFSTNKIISKKTHFFTQKPPKTTIKYRPLLSTTTVNAHDVK